MGCWEGLFLYSESSTTAAFGRGGFIVLIVHVVIHFPVVHYKYLNIFIKFDPVASSFGNFLSLVVIPN